MTMAKTMLRSSLKHLSTWTCIRGKSLPLMFDRIVSSFSTCSTSNDNNKTQQQRTVKSALPTKANIVIVGGGIIGNSVAYHLGKLGVEDVCLLEQSQLTSGTTWHAAGLVNTYGSMSETSIKMRQYTRDLYANILPEETGDDAGFQPVGFIELACDSDRLYQYRKVAAFNRFIGTDVREITPTAVKDLFPLTDTADVLAGFHVPTDGRVNPVDATMALKKAATKLYGVKVYENARVASVEQNYTKSNNLLPHVTGVRLESGHEIEANVVVNCAGMWAGALGATCGVHTIPNQAAEHYYIITDSMEDLVDPSWPVIEDSSKCVYIRPEGAGLLLGLFEWDGASWNADKGVPKDFSFGEIQPDMERILPYLEEAYKRVPEAQNYGIKSFFCGPESFTPDNMPVVGEAPYLKNFYIAAGMNSLGITTGGGIGKVLAQWIQDGHPPTNWDVTGINMNRFHAYQSNPEYRKERSGEALGHTYKTHYPDMQYDTCRGAKKSPFHERLLEQGAYMKDVSGWESPGWYNWELGVKAGCSFGREKWFPQWQSEHFACRNNVALFDMTFMSKFLVQGKDAGAFLNRLSTANIVGEKPQITYTQWLNEQGTIEADLTVTQLNPYEYLVVATDTMHHHVLSHMKNRLTNSLHATVTDVTARYAQLNLQGPQSRELLQRLTSTCLSTDDFPFRHVAEIDIGLARVLCMRITYVGELGYELFIPVEQALHVYDRIWKVGEEMGLSPAGLRALGSLRMVSPVIFTLIKSLLRR